MTKSGFDTANLPKGARDRMRVEANPVFARHILEPIFEINCRLYFKPLLAAHRAWLVMLAERGIVPRNDAAAIFLALDAIEKVGPDAARPFDPGLDYYYLHIERALVQRVPRGEAIVGNLNLGRTRPEPLARMVVRDALAKTLEMVIKIRRELLAKAESEADAVMPGYTHLQHAQPTTFGHYLLAIHDHLERDTDRLLAAYDTTDRCTLGCGAMSGTSLDIDRLRVMNLLGFPGLCENTVDSVSATDHVMQAVAALASTMNIIARFCQDLYIWSSQEYGMVDVGDAFSSPSSLMPQKKNALVLEYLRSRAARIIGALTACYAVMQNVGYMDTEEVEIECYLPLYEAFSIVDEALPTIAALIPAMQTNRKLMRERAAWGFSSVTALAEAIQTQKGFSYRTAHRVVARAVLIAVENGKDATGIDSALLDIAAREMIDQPIVMTDDNISQCLDPRRFVDQHKVQGGTAPAEVRRMLKLRHGALASSESRIQENAQRVRRADKDLQDAVLSVIRRPGDSR